MTAIFKKVKVEWRGEPVELQATMRTINDIEQTVSLAQLAQRVSAGDIPISHLATVFACLLRAAGVAVSDDEVYSAMFGGDDDIDQNALMQAAVSAFECVFPSNTGGGRRGSASKKAKRRAK